MASRRSPPTAAPDDNPPSPPPPPTPHELPVSDSVPATPYNPIISETPPQTPVKSTPKQTTPVPTPTSTPSASPLKPLDPFVTSPQAHQQQSPSPPQDDIDTDVDDGLAVVAAETAARIASASSPLPLPLPNEDDLVNEDEVQQPQPPASSPPLHDTPADASRAVASSAKLASVSESEAHPLEQPDPPQQPNDPELDIDSSDVEGAPLPPLPPHDPLASANSATQPSPSSPGEQPEQIERPEQPEQPEQVDLPEQPEQTGQSGQPEQVEQAAEQPEQPEQLQQAEQPGLAPQPLRRVSPRLASSFKTSGSGKPQTPENPAPESPPPADHTTSPKGIEDTRPAAPPPRRASSRLAKQLPEASRQQIVPTSPPNAPLVDSPEAIVVASSSDQDSPPRKARRTSQARSKSSTTVSYPTRSRTRPQSPVRTRRARLSEPPPPPPVRPPSTRRASRKQTDRPPAKGDQLRILWHIDEQYYPCVVDSVLALRGRKFYDVKYDSGEQEFYVDLSVRKWRYVNNTLEQNYSPRFQEDALFDRRWKVAVDWATYPKIGDKVYVEWHVDEVYYPGHVKDVMQVDGRQYYDVYYEGGDHEFFLDLTVRGWTFHKDGDPNLRNREQLKSKKPPSRRATIEDPRGRRKTQSPPLPQANVSVPKNSSLQSLPRRSSGSRALSSMAEDNVLTEKDLVPSSPSDVGASPVFRGPSRLKFLGDMEKDTPISIPDSPDVGEPQSPRTPPDSRIVERDLITPNPNAAEMETTDVPVTKAKHTDGQSGVTSNSGNQVQDGSNVQGETDQAMSDILTSHFGGPAHGTGDHPFDSSSRVDSNPHEDPMDIEPPIPKNQVTPQKPRSMYDASPNRDGRTAKTPPRTAWQSPAADSRFFKNISEPEPQDSPADTPKVTSQQNCADEKITGPARKNLSAPTRQIRNSRPARPTKPVPRQVSPPSSPQISKPASSHPRAEGQPVSSSDQHRVLADKRPTPQPSKLKLITNPPKQRQTFPDAHTPRQSSAPRPSKVTQKRSRFGVAEIIVVAGQAAHKWFKEESEELSENLDFLTSQISKLRRIYKHHKNEEHRAETQSEAPSSSPQLPAKAPDDEAKQQLISLKSNVLSQVQRFRNTVETRERTVKKQLTLLRGELNSQNRAVLESGRVLRSLDIKGLDTLGSLDPKTRNKLDIPAPVAPRALPGSAVNPAQVQKDAAASHAARENATVVWSLRRKLADMVTRSDYLADEVRRLQSREKDLEQQRKAALSEVTKARAERDKARDKDIGMETEYPPTPVPPPRRPVPIKSIGPSKPVGIVKKKLNVPRGSDASRSTGRANRKSLPATQSKYRPPPPPTPQTLALPQRPPPPRPSSQATASPSLQLPPPPSPPQPSQSAAKTSASVPQAPVASEQPLPPIPRKARSRLSDRAGGAPLQGSLMGKQAAELLSMICAVWLLQDESRSEPPKEPGDRMAVWVRNCVGNCLKHVSSFLDNSSGGLMSIKRSLRDDMDGEHIYTDWVLSEEHNELNKARCNYRIWEPTLEDREWLAERDVLKGISKCYRLAFASSESRGNFSMLAYAKTVARKSVSDFDVFYPHTTPQPQPLLPAPKKDVQVLPTQAVLYTSTNPRVPTAVVTPNNNAQGETAKAAAPVTQPVITSVLGSKAITETAGATARRDINPNSAQPVTSLSQSLTQSTPAHVSRVDQPDIKETPSQSQSSNEATPVVAPPNSKKTEDAKGCEQPTTTFPSATPPPKESTCPPESITKETNPISSSVDRSIPSAQGEGDEKNLITEKEQAPHAPRQGSESKPGLLSSQRTTKRPVTVGLPFVAAPADAQVSAQKQPVRSLGSKPSTILESSPANALPVTHRPDTLSAPPDAAVPDPVNSPTGLEGSSASQVTSQKKAQSNEGGAPVPLEVPLPSRKDMPPPLPTPKPNSVPNAKATEPLNKHAELVNRVMANADAAKKSSSLLPSVAPSSTIMATQRTSSAAATDLASTVPGPQRPSTQNSRITNAPFSMRDSEVVSGAIAGTDEGTIETPVGSIPPLPSKPQIKRGRGRPPKNGRSSKISKLGAKSSISKSRSKTSSEKKLSAAPRAISLYGLNPPAIHDVNDMLDVPDVPDLNAATPPSSPERIVKTTKTKAKVITNTGGTRTRRRSSKAQKGPATIVQNRAAVGGHAVPPRENLSPMETELTVPVTSRDQFPSDDPNQSGVAHPVPPHHDAPIGSLARGTADGPGHDAPSPSVALPPSSEPQAASNQRNDHFPLSADVSNPPSSQEWNQRYGVTKKGLPNEMQDTAAEQQDNTTIGIANNTAIGTSEAMGTVNPNASPAWRPTASPADNQVGRKLSMPNSGGGKLTGSVEISFDGLDVPTPPVQTPAAVGMNEADGDFGSTAALPSPPRSMRPRHSSNQESYQTPRKRPLGFKSLPLPPPRRRSAIVGNEEINEEDERWTGNNNRLRGNNPGDGPDEPGGASAGVNVERYSTHDGSVHHNTGLRNGAGIEDAGQQERGEGEDMRSRRDEGLGIGQKGISQGFIANQNNGTAQVGMKGPVGIHVSASVGVENSHSHYQSNLDRSSGDMGQVDLMNPPTPSSFPGLEGYNLSMGDRDTQGTGNAEVGERYGANTMTQEPAYNGSGNVRGAQAASSQHMAHQHMQPHHVPAQHMSGQHLAAQHVQAQHMPSQHIPAQQMPVQHMGHHASQAHGGNNNSNANLGNLLHHIPRQDNRGPGPGAPGTDIHAEVHDGGIHAQQHRAYGDAVPRGPH